ncbi:hypothetical protein Tco_0674959 [Tanacetum coccineum]
MVTPAEKRDPNKYCEFHADTGHSTNECMQLRKQIDEMIKAGKLSQFIKELKQNDKPKAPKKGETAEKERPLAILIVQPWERVAKQKVTQSFSSETTISFPPLGDEDETEGPMIIEAEIGGHFVHRMSPSQHNGLIGRPGIRKIRAIPSTTHGMLKFPVEGGTVTLRSSRIIPMECAMISGPSTRPPEVGKILEEKIRVAIHPEYPEQTIAIGSTLTEKGRKELSEHRLNVREGYSPIRQKKRGQAPERNKAIHEEVEKLVDAGIMKEVHYHNWLSNPVMVKKHDGS